MLLWNVYELKTTPYFWKLSHLSMTASLKSSWTSPDMQASDLLATYASPQQETASMHLHGELQEELPAMSNTQLQAGLNQGNSPLMGSFSDREVWRF